jgi:hypothetical protein
MIYSSILPFITPLLIGFTVVLILWPGGLKENLILKGLLSVGVGFGLISDLFFIWCLFFTPAGRTYFVFEFGVLLGLILLLILLRRKEIRSIFKPEKKISSKPRNRLPWISWLLLATLSASVAFAAATFFMISFLEPHGTFDAYAIWNFKARVFFLDPSHWKEALSPVQDWMTHPDYPLMLPMNVTRAWEMIKNDNTRVPILLAGLFTLSTAGLLFAGLRSLRSLAQGPLGGMILFATPWLVTIGRAQKADIPLTYFILAACVLFVFYWREKKRNYLVLAGFMAGFAAWTKNEGELIVLVLMVMHSILIVWSGNRRSFWKELLPLLIGLALPVLVLAYFKVNLAAANDIFQGQNSGTFLQKITDMSRYAAIASSYWGLLLNFGGWVFPFIPVLAVYAWFFHGKHAIGEKKIIIVLAGFCALVLLGYTAIYLISPYPIEWHLHTSADRLWMHIYPVALLTVFLWTETPEQLFKK